MFSKSSKRLGHFKKLSFFPKPKRSFLKTIEKRIEKRSFNDRFQKRLTTLYKNVCRLMKHEKLNIKHEA